MAGPFPPLAGERVPVTSSAPPSGTLRRAPPLSGAGALPRRSSARVAFAVASWASTWDRAACGARGREGAGI